MTNNKLQLILSFVLGMLFCLILILAAKGSTLMQDGRSGMDMHKNTQKIVGNVYSESMCTAMACAEENQCCNSCGGYLYIAESKESMDRTYIYKGGEEFYQCRGNECEMKCDEKFTEGHKYEIIGEVRTGGDALPLDGKYIIPTDIKALGH